MTTPALPVPDPAAAIDVGSEQLHVSIAGGPPKVFGTVTGQLRALRDWLKNWKNEKQFTAWLGLAPGSKQSGKRRGSQKRSRNRAGRLFCIIARSVGRSVDPALGGFYGGSKGDAAGWWPIWRWRANWPNCSGV
ncbi:MAG TPA: transposase [Candidatus Paceibacterota bacterium]|nr:transposase [Candidatus Paceibacterota bacterium]